MTLLNYDSQYFLNIGFYLTALGGRLDPADSSATYAAAHRRCSERTTRHSEKFSTLAKIV